jgi:prepilin signal peptidase PulO-like enzyme (type II secretory pathway)
MPSLTFDRYWQALISSTKQALLIKKLFFFFLFSGLFLLVVLYLEPPKSWQEASVFQIMAFFLPMLLAIMSLVDILTHYLPHSFIISLGIILLIAFFGAGQLNYLTAILVILVTALSFRIFPKMRLPRFRLTPSSKIPKLHMQKQEPPKLRRLRRLK